MFALCKQLSYLKACGVFFLVILLSEFWGIYFCRFGFLSLMEEFSLTYCVFCIGDIITVVVSEQKCYLLLFFFLVYSLCFCLVPQVHWPGRALRLLSWLVEFPGIMDCLHLDSLSEIRPIIF